MLDRGAAHILHLYGQRVDVEFRRFMENLFPKAFHPAPIKKVSRMMSKISDDLELPAPASKKWPIKAPSRCPMCCAHILFESRSDPEYEGRGVGLSS